MAVGLDSGLAVSDFRRRQLNLVILLDVSTSMGSPFSQYYYDALGKRVNLTEGGEPLQAASCRAAASGCTDLLTGCKPHLLRCPTVCLCPSLKS